MQESICDSTAEIVGLVIRVWQNRAGREKCVTPINMCGLFIGTAPRAAVRGRSNEAGRSSWREFFVRNSSGTRIYPGQRSRTDFAPLERSVRLKNCLPSQICDDSDHWAERKLGHHYVRINNKTIEIR